MSVALATATRSLTLGPTMSSHLPARLREILVCPVCRAELRLQSDAMQCGGCGASFSLQDGVPIFLPGAVENAEDHVSNPIAPQFEAFLRAGSDFILHIGAGGTARRFPNCVEFEHKIFRHTDVVGDAHHLPFREAVFDRVFALNVFEHLQDPTLAAAEIFRVLKPGGAVAIHTAFLQALHEEPQHFYNATEFGVRSWFSLFEIETVHVTGNFGPGIMLGYLTSNVLEAARRGGTGPSELRELSSTTIGQWAEFWARGVEPPAGFHTLQNLPQTEQKRVAAGFELLARKPGTTA